MAASTDDKKVEMTAPVNSTNMTTPEAKKVKMVKIKTHRPIRLNDGTMVAPNETVLVTEEEAKMFCDKKFRGAYRFSGERRCSAQDLDLKFARAERVG